MLSAACEHIAELNKRAAEAELRLKRLYDAIEAGVADLDDPALKDRIAGLKAARDQAQADALRAQAMLESAAHQAVTPQMLRQFANAARNRMRADGAMPRPPPATRPAGRGRGGPHHGAQEQPAPNLGGDL
jgi:hypothetical protein